jgi:hypothetical protein
MDLEQALSLFLVSRVRRKKPVSRNSTTEA